MYVSKKDLKTIHELVAYVDGAREAVEDPEKVEYWDDLFSDTVSLKDKMVSQFDKQEQDAEVRRRAKEILKKNNNGKRD